MALFGPRLDRPSALGDDGRPRATSLGVASLLVVLLLLASTSCVWRFGIGSESLSIGWLGQVTVPALIVPQCAGGFQFALGFATVTGLVTAGLALLGRQRLSSLFIGQILFLPAGTALVSGLGLLLVRSPAWGVFFTGFSLAMVALGSTWANSASAETVRPALFQTGLSYVSVLVWLVFGGLLVSAVLLVRLVVTGSPSPTVSLIVFLVFVLVSAVAFRLGLRWLPVRQLTPSRLSAVVDTRLGWIRTVNTTVAVVSLIAIVAAIVSGVLGLFELLYATAPPIATGFRLLTALPVVIVVLGLGLLTAVLGILSLALRRLTRPVDASSNRLLAPMLAGLFLVLGLIPFMAQLVPVPIPLSLGVLVASAVFGPLGLYAVGWAFVAAQYVSLVPERVGGPAVAAAGMVVATVGAALVGLPTPAVLATAVGAMVVWDTSAFGLGLTAELGHIPGTRRLELYHALATIGLGLAAWLLLSGVGVARNALAGARPALLAGSLAVLGVLVLLFSVRGYAGEEPAE